jgi:uncharacterized protein YyaL (SSP411 family)
MDFTSTICPPSFSLIAFHLMSLQLASSYDPKFGGFGSAPKFPRPVEDYIMLYRFRKLMEAGKESEAQNIKKMVTHTLDCMARGGVHDHVGGGFHRYSVDECWHGKLALSSRRNFF